MRRLVVEMPPSHAAGWSRRLAWFALLVVAIAVLLARFDRIEVAAALAVLGAGLAVAVAAAVLAVSGLVSIWNEGRPGFGAASAGLFVAACMLAYPSFLAVQALRLPRLTDISTDTAEPPSFSRSRRALELRGGRTPPESTARNRAEQAQAYPGIAPVTLEIPPSEVFALVQKAAAQRGWQVIETAAPGGRTGIGRLEAIDRSLVMRFPDDVTVRIRPTAAGARVDVRSASRIGTHDFGANARRIQAFLQTLQDLADER
jgi:uncharacterized protein (DUF1499 family)